MGRITFLLVCSLFVLELVFVVPHGFAIDESLKKEYDRAISDYNKTLEKNPRDAEAYTNRGIAYGQKKEYDRAISDFNKALEINQKLMGAYYYRGIAYYEKKDYDKAWHDVHKAQSLGFQAPPSVLEALRKASLEKPQR
ncbi:MAG TPA: tetratricopeptide repeat protein [Thermodesulfovibrionales bacterium]|nr:tetratricopeptide repeat protein [Thermodesulfovibrionales bacterium]